MDLGVFSGAGVIFYQWGTSVVFWTIACFLCGLTGFGGLYLRKRKRYNKPVLELFEVGNVVYKSDGKVDWEKSAGLFDFKLTEGGWFRSRWTLFNLWDYGTENIFQMKDGTRVYDVSHNDYKRINGKNGLVVIRDPNDSRFAIPIGKFALTANAKEAMADIAPIDLRNAAVSAIEAVDIEMKTKWEKWAPILTAGFLGMVLIFSILLIAQYGKHNIEQVTELLRYVSDKVSITKGVSP